MAGQRFEDLIAWQRARALTQCVHRLANQGGMSDDKALRWQIQRAADSCPLNIAEGHGRQNPLEFRKHLRYAMGSAREVQSALYLALDRMALGRAQFEEAYGLAEEVVATCASLAAHQLAKARKSDKEQR